MRKSLCVHTLAEGLSTKTKVQIAEIGAATTKDRHEWCQSSTAVYGLFLLHAFSTYRTDDVMMLTSFDINSDKNG